MKSILRNYFELRIGESEFRGVCRSLSAVRRQRYLFLSVLLIGLFTAIFEGGSIAIFGAAVGVLTGNGEGIIEIVGRWFGDIAGNFFGPLESTDLFYLLIVIGILSQVIRSGLSYAGAVTSGYLSLMVQRDIAKHATLHTMELTYESITKYPAGNIATLVEQTKVLALLVAQLSKGVLTFLMLVAYTVLGLMTSMYSGLVIVLVCVVLWISLRKLLRKLSRYTTKEVNAELELWKQMVEYLNAPRLLRAFNATTLAGASINEARGRQLFSIFRGNIVQALVDPVLEIFFIAVVGALIIGGSFYFGAEAADRVPELFVFIVLIVRVKPQIVAANQVRLRFARMLPRVSIVEGLLASDDKKFERTDGINIDNLMNNISFNDVYFKYEDSAHEVLNGASFDIPKGKTIALLGASGAGKTTVVDLILGLHSPVRGKILVDGQNLEQIDLTSWRNIIGTVEQDVFLLNSTIRENIVFARSGCSQTDVEKAAELSGAADFILKTSNGYDTVIGDRGSKLSGGQRQRLALARALVRAPEILLLDEATSALDSESEDVIKDALQEMHGQKTILIVTHRLSTIIGVDWIVVLGGGQVIEQGTFEMLSSNDGFFKRNFARDVE